MHKICFTFYFSTLLFPCSGWTRAIVLSVDAEWLCCAYTLLYLPFYYILWVFHLVHIARASRVRYFTARTHPYVCELSGGWICVCEHIACPSDEQQQNSRQNKLEKYSRTIAHRSFNMEPKNGASAREMREMCRKLMGQIGINGVMGFRFVCECARE